MLKKSIKVIALTALMSASIVSAPLFAMAGTDHHKGDIKNGEYLPGDFHQHSWFTDGSQKFTQMMDENNTYLEWWANSEHGGSYAKDGEGNLWTDTSVYPVNPILGDNASSGKMWRWQSLRDFVYPMIQDARELYPEKVIISGLEQNVPGHEHGSTAIYQYDGTATAISEYEYRFDKSDKDTSRDGEKSLLNKRNLSRDLYNKLGGVLSKTNLSKDDTILAVEWMQGLRDARIGDAWFVPAHVERAQSYTIEDFRDFMDAGPDVAVGFEGAPGHQVESGRGGFGGGAVGGGAYGGAGFFVAKVGGLWDGLSAEGRKYFDFASSDCHSNWTYGGGDFWPGEYQKNYTFVDTHNRDQIQAVFDGVHSGNSWNVMGDLIDELQFIAESKEQKTAMMGQTLKVKKGETVQITIKVHDPNGPNNCPLDMNNPSLEQVGIEQPLSEPKLDHIDLIAGTITGNVATTSPDGIAATDYGTDTKVTSRFYRDADENGYMTYVIIIKPKASMFIRLRGTNMPAGVPNETDASGNPLVDSEAASNIYGPMVNDNLKANLFSGVELHTSGDVPLKYVAAAYADLWFYSNPIYIEVVK